MELNWNLKGKVYLNNEHFYVLKQWYVSFHSRIFSSSLLTTLQPDNFAQDVQETKPFEQVFKS